MRYIIISLVRYEMDTLKVMEGTQNIQSVISDMLLFDAAGDRSFIMLRLNAGLAICTLHAS